VKNRDFLAQYLFIVYQRLSNFRVYSMLKAMIESRID